jgi:2-amino-4-hydroxy-6-hydroxymethyldihydropteridine diphosphokinase
MIGQEHQVCLLVGSNIQPETNLVRGIELLRQKIKVLHISSVWETPAVGSDGPDFFNVAIMIRTSLKADELKDGVLRPLEAQFGRVRSADKNAARPIDFDIIIFNAKLLDASLFQHAHRAVPVAEILPDYRSDRGEILSVVASELAKMTSIRLISGVLINDQ